MPKFDDIAKASQGGQGASKGNPGQRILYPAIVIPGGTDDVTKQNRIRARIVAVDENGNIIGKQTDIDDNYNAYAGKDQQVPDDKLPICIPLLPEIIHFRPLPGELVWVILSNPKDITAPRFWIGPIITSQLNLKYEAFESANRIMEQSAFLKNKQIQNDDRSFNVFPTEADVALQGRNDADIILRPREALLIAGKFNKEKYEINTETPSYLNLRQFERAKSYTKKTPNENPRVAPKPIPTTSIQISLFQSTGGNYNATIEVFQLNRKSVQTESLAIQTFSKSNKNEVLDLIKAQVSHYQTKFSTWRLDYTNIPELDSLPKVYTPVKNSREKSILEPDDDLLQRYSQSTLISTNVNIYSPRGKFRSSSPNPYEINEDLKSFGDLANTLHPAVFGDELIKLLDIIVRILLQHIHHPQKPLLSTDLSKELSKYTIDGVLQELISNHIRIN